MPVIKTVTGILCNNAVPINHGLYGVGATDDNPCDLFERINFPVDDFFPPEKSDFTDNDNCNFNQNTKC